MQGGGFGGVGWGASGDFWELVLALEEAFDGALGLGHGRVEGHGWVAGWRDGGVVGWWGGGRKWCENGVRVV